MNAYIRQVLNSKLAEYQSFDFIKHDPIQIPHRFSIKQDIEVSGYFAAIFAWGNRKTIIAKLTELMARMDNCPYQFVLQHQLSDLKVFDGFVHRIFSAHEVKGLIRFLNIQYRKYRTLEDVFAPDETYNHPDTFIALNNYAEAFALVAQTDKRLLRLAAPPKSGSAAKRMCMYLRWMVRSDEIDFGIFKKIKPNQLVMPVDVHVLRATKQLGIATRNIADWKTAIEITEAVRLLDPSDPIKYDFALFGLGIESGKTEGR